jgi:hypothetical protein
MKLVLTALALIISHASAMDYVSIWDNLNEADYVVVGTLTHTEEKFHYHTARGDSGDQITHYRGGQIICFKALREWSFSQWETSNVFEFPEPERMKSLGPQGLKEIEVLFDERYLKRIEDKTLWVWVLKRNPFSREYYAKPMINAGREEEKAQILEIIEEAKDSIQSKPKSEPVGAGQRR